MNQILKLLIVPLLLFSFSCTQINRAPVTVPKKEKCAILPFSNLSDTPLAGERVAAILYGVMKSKGYNVDLYFSPKEEDFTQQEIEKLEKEAEKEFNCIIGGSVNEWRYKVGIDGEPAVSVTYTVKNVKTGTITSGTVSGTDWGHKSLGLLTQELFNKVF